MGNYPRDPVRKGLRNKATTDFLICCGLKKPEKDMNRKKTRI